MFKVTTALATTCTMEHDQRAWLVDGFRGLRSTARAMAVWLEPQAGFCQDKSHYLPL